MCVDVFSDVLFLLLLFCGSDFLLRKTQEIKYAPNEEYIRDVLPIFHHSGFQLLDWHFGLGDFRDF